MQGFFLLRPVAKSGPGRFGPGLDVRCVGPELNGYPLCGPELDGIRWCELALGPRWPSVRSVGPELDGYPRCGPELDGDCGIGHSELD